MHTTFRFLFPHVICLSFVAGLHMRPTSKSGQNSSAKSSNSSKGLIVHDYATIEANPGVAALKVDTSKRVDHDASKRVKLHDTRFTTGKVLTFETIWNSKAYKTARAKKINQKYVSCFDPEAGYTCSNFPASKADTCCPWCWAMMDDTRCDNWTVAVYAGPSSIPVPEGSEAGGSAVPPIVSYDVTVATNAPAPPPTVIVHYEEAPDQTLDLSNVKVSVVGEENNVEVSVGGADIPITDGGATAALPIEVNGVANPGLASLNSEKHPTWKPAVYQEYAGDDADCDRPLASMTFTETTGEDRFRWQILTKGSRMTMGRCYKVFMNPWMFPMRSIKCQCNQRHNSKYDSGCIHCEQFVDDRCDRKLSNTQFCFPHGYYQDGYFRTESQKTELPWTQSGQAWTPTTISSKARDARGLEKVDFDSLRSPQADFDKPVIADYYYWRNSPKGTCFRSFPRSTGPVTNMYADSSYNIRAQMNFRFPNSEEECSNTLGGAIPVCHPRATISDLGGSPSDITCVKPCPNWSIDDGRSHSRSYEQDFQYQCLDKARYYAATDNYDHPDYEPPTEVPTPFPTPPQPTPLPTPTPPIRRRRARRRRTRRRRTRRRRFRRRRIRRRRFRRRRYRRRRYRRRRYRRRRYRRRRYRRRRYRRRRFRRRGAKPHNGWVWNDD